MRSFLSEYLEQKNKTFLRKLAQQNLAHRLSQKESQAFQGTETLKSVFLFPQIFNFSFEQKKKKKFSFFGRESACLLASQKRKIGAGTSYFSQALSFLRLFEYNKRDEEIKLLSFIKTKMIRFQQALAEFAKKLCRKGFPEITVKKYLELTERVYRECEKIEERDSITCREIENRIYSNKKISRGTKNVYAVQIRAFLRFCRSLDLQVINPEQIAVQKYHLKEARYLNEEEEKTILKHLKNNNVNPNLRASILLMLTTGLRVSEACKLTKQNFRNAVLVNQMYQLPLEWKWAKTRPVFIPPKIYKELETFSNHHNKRTILSVKTDQIQKLIKKFSQEIAIVFTAHTFRHTYCTKLVQNGADIYKVQKLAWHSSIITTSRYLHTCNRELAETAHIISDIKY